MSYRIRYGKPRSRWPWWALGMGVLTVCGAAWKYDALARYVGGMILGPH